MIDSFVHLFLLHGRDVFWVTRAKDNMSYYIIKKRKCSGTIQQDLTISLNIKKTSDEYPETLRMIVAIVTVDGKDVEMTFLTNNMEWSPTSICDLFKARWCVEVFFKQLKQTLQLADFLGHNENAVRWQIWTALLTYVLLRLIEYLSNWKVSFARLFTTIRGVLWSRYDLFRILEFCGTALGRQRTCAQSDQLFIPGLETFLVGQQM